MPLFHTTVAAGTNDAGKQVSVTAWNEPHTVDYEGIDFPYVGSEPAPPIADHVKLFGQKIGRMMVAIMGPTGLSTTLMPHMGRNGFAMWTPVPNSTTISAIGEGALSATGTATAANYATTNLFSRSRRVLYTQGSAGSTAVAGYRLSSARYRLQDGFHHLARVGGNVGPSTASHRFFCGMTSATTAPSDVQPSSLVNMVGVGYDSADLNIQVMHNDASGAATKIDTGIPVPTANAVDVLSVIIFSGPGTTTVSVTVVNETTGVRFTTDIESVDLPAATQTLAPRCYISAGGTSIAPSLALFGLYIETDN